MSLRHPVGYKVQGGEDPSDALFLYVIFRKRAPIISGSLVKNDLQPRGSYESWPHCRV